MSLSLSWTKQKYFYFNKMKILFKYCADMKNCESFRSFGFKSILKNFIQYKISNCKVVRFLININYKRRIIIDNGRMKSLIRRINKLKKNYDNST